MASVKITALPAISSVAEADLLPVVDDTDTTTKKATAAQLKQFMRGEIVRKLADETKTSDDTPAMDSDLVLTVGVAGPSTYYFYAMLRFDLPDNGLGANNGGVQWALWGTVVGGVTGLTCYLNKSASLSAPNADIGPNIASANFSPPTYDTLTYILEGIIELSTAGTLGIQWAQAVSDVDPAILKKNSFFRVERLA